MRLEKHSSSWSLFSRTLLKVVSQVLQTDRQLFSCFPDRQKVDTKFSRQFQTVGNTIIVFDNNFQFHFICVCVLSQPKLILNPTQKDLWLEDIHSSHFKPTPHHPIHPTSYLYIDIGSWKDLYQVLLGVYLCQCWIVEFKRIMQPVLFMFSFQILSPLKNALKVDGYCQAQAKLQLQLA